MTLARRVIPTILVRDGQVVKGRAFAADRVVGTPVQTARVYAARDVDELVVLDVSARAQGRAIDVALIEAISETLFIPLAVGGGISSVEDARRLIAGGADKVVLGCRVESFGLAHEIAVALGSNAVVVSVNAQADGRVHHWVPNALPPHELYEMMPPAENFARTAWEFGAGEILLQSIPRDGTLEGYDLELLRRVRAAVPDTNLIVSGGARDYEDLALALERGADGVAAGALWTFTDATPAGAKAFLAQRGFPMRPVEVPA